jgi:hypothetical protein
MPRAQELLFEQSGSGRLRQLLVGVLVSQVDPLLPFDFAECGRRVATLGRD